MPFFSRRKLRTAPAPKGTGAAGKVPFTHPVLGEIVLCRSARARRLSISVRPGGEVRLTLPRGMAEAEALRFLDAKQAWVEQARLRAARRNPPRIIAPPYATRSHVLRLLPASCREAGFRVADGVITVSYPAGMHYESDGVQAAIKRGIEEAWRIEAKAYLPARTAELCRLTGLHCGTVTIRNSRTRWGSCSPDNSLSLSLHLMKLPDALIDYIILHELCHTVHKNHGVQFHALLDRVTGGKHLTLRKALRTFSTRW